MERLQIEYLPLDALTPYENNARKHEKADLETIESSIENFGMCDPIGVWGKKNIIVEGHGRLLALKELGYTEAPVIHLDFLTDEERKAYALAHNKTAEMSEWDFDKLDAEIASINALDMSQFGFDLSEFSGDYDGEDFDDEDDVLIDDENTTYYFPLEEIQQDIIDGWVTYETLSDYVKNIIDIPTAKYQYNRLCNGYNDGYNISLLFNPHRLLTETIKSKSIFYGINNDDNYKRAFSRYLVQTAKKVVPYAQHYKFIGIGSGGYQYVNEFQPYLARDIYKKYCKDGDKILNPCAGWGGRLIGLSACGFKDIEYVETDPSTKTFEGLTKLKEFLRLGDNYKQYNFPFEDLTVKENYFDFAFTSPPYFDTERYADEETQSFADKDNYEAWRDGFLYVMLDKIVYSLKRGGVCLLNVGKVRYPIDEDIINYMRSAYNIECKRVKDFKIGGAGIGARTDDDGDGEPFIEFTKP